jgi:hypothetical protein
VGAQTFQLTLVAEGDGDTNNNIHGLRWLLKVAHRRFGLRCIDICEQPQGRELLAPRTSSKQRGPKWNHHQRRNLRHLQSRKS